MGNSTPIKDRTIASIECHLAPHHFGGKNTVSRIITQGNMEIPYCEFTLLPGVGVYVKGTNGKELIVPFSNIKNIEIQSEQKGGFKQT